MALTKAEVIALTAVLSAIVGFILQQHRKPVAPGGPIGNASAADLQAAAAEDKASPAQAQATNAPQVPIPQPNIRPELLSGLNPGSVLTNDLGAKDWASVRDSLRKPWTDYGFTFSGEGNLNLAAPTWVRDAIPADVRALYESKGGSWQDVGLRVN